MIFIQRLRKNILVSNFLSLTSLQMFNYLLPLLTVPYLFRVLGVDKFGLLTFAYAFIQYFIVITDFGFNLSATKFISENRNEKTKINEYVNSVFLAKFLLFLLSSCVLIVTVFSIERFYSEWRVYLLYLGMILGNVIFPVWYFQGIEKMKFITIINVLAKTLSICPIFFVVKNNSDYIFVPMFYSIGYLLAGLYSILVVYGRMGMRFFIPPFINVLNCLLNSATYFVSRISISLYTVSNSFVIGLALGDNAVGYYAIAEKVYQAFNSLFLPLSSTIFPYMAKNKNINLFKKIFSYSMFINITIVIIGILCSTFIMNIIYNEINMESIKILNVLMISLVFSVPSVLIGYPFLAALGHPKYTNWTVVIGSVIHILILFILWITGSISLFLVACTVVLTELIIFIQRLYGIHKYKLI